MTRSLLSSLYLFNSSLTVALRNRSAIMTLPMQLKQRLPSTLRKHCLPLVSHLFPLFPSLNLISLLFSPPSLSSPSPVESTRDPPAYFAKKLNDSMRGIGTDEARLIRIIVSRSEIDLPEIRMSYRRQFKIALERDISGQSLLYLLVIPELLGCLFHLVL